MAAVVLFIPALYAKEVNNMAHLFLTSSSSENIRSTTSEKDSPNLPSCLRR